MKQHVKYHPLIGTVQHYVKKKHLLHSGETIIAAVSGGADSMVMLDMLVNLRKLWNLKIIVAHVNYQLRGKESNGDEQLVRKTAKRYGLPFHSMRSETKSVARQKKQSLQAAAREIRYTFFETLKQSLNADAVATAHHADDNAETMLINLLRGSGIDGLAGIPPRRDAVIRPLLCIRRSDILRYAKEQNVKYRVDSTNAGDDYTRNFLRIKIIPSLQKRVNPSLNETLLHEAELFRTAADFVHIETKKVFQNIVSSDTIDLKKLEMVHPFIQESIIRRMLSERKIEPTFLNTDSIMELKISQKGSSVNLQSGWTAERLAKSIVIQKNDAQSFEYTMERAGTLSADGFNITVKKFAVPGNKKGRNPSTEYVDAATLVFPLIIRSWRPGDFFIPIGMRGKKKLSDFFGEQKIANKEKTGIPVVESNGNIVWIAGMRLDERYKITDSTTSTYQLTIKHNGKKNHHR